jgi:hypothetical protein
LLAVLVLSYCYAQVLDAEDACEESDDIDLVQTQKHVLKARSLSMQEKSLVGQAQRTNAVWPGKKKKLQATMEQACKKEACINLDDPPKERWKSLAAKYKADWIELIDTTLTVIEAQFNATTLEDWWNNSNVYPEYMEEMEGIIEVLDDPRATLKRFTLFHLVYELGNPTLTQAPGCSGLLVRQSDASILHLRNLEYMLPTDAGKYTFEVTFYRDGEPLFVFVNFLMVGLHTGMRFNGWSFEQNTRFANNHADTNLINARKGGLPFMFAARKVMEDVPDYATAVKTLEGLKMMAPQYFIIAGIKDDEGATFTVDGFQPHPQPFTTTLTLESSIGRWFLVQMNDDVWGAPRDIRRESAIEQLNALGEKANESALEKVVTTYPLFSDVATIFTWIANPAKSTHRLLVHRNVTARQPDIFAHGIPFEDLFKLAAQFGADKIGE